LSGKITSGVGTDRIKNAEKESEDLSNMLGRVPSIGLFEFMFGVKF
jgi:hypothetical protein